MHFVVEELDILLCNVDIKISNCGFVCKAFFLMGMGLALKEFMLYLLPGISFSNDIVCTFS